MAEINEKCINCLKYKLDSKTSAAIPVVNGGFVGRRACSAGGWVSESADCEIPEKEEFKNIGGYLDAFLTPARYIGTQTTGFNC